MLYYEKENDSRYIIKASKDAKIIIGDFVKDVDGYFYFFIYDYNGGSFSSELLKELSKKLDEINKPWNDIVEKFLDACNEPS